MDRYSESEETRLIEDPPDEIMEKTPVVIKFSRKAFRRSCDEVENMMRAYGFFTKMITHEKENYLFLWASKEKLLDLADETELIKKTVSGTMQKVNAKCITEYILPGMSDNDIVRNCEALFLIKDFVKPELVRNIRNEIIEEIFPMHDKSLNNIDFNYTQPAMSIEKIRNYFGSSIGMYFAFTEYYTKALFCPVLFGFFLLFFNLNLVYVCVFLVVWTTVFLKLWKRKCAGYAYDWGTIEMTSFDKPRTAYKGDITVDPVTGKQTVYYDMKSTYIQMYLVSYPVVLACVVAVAFLAAYQFKIEEKFRSDFGIDSWLLYIPGIVQSLLICIFSWGYEKFATFLTNRENHRTRLQYDRHRIIKLILFEIVNNFFPLLYIAFKLQDFGQLKYQHRMQFLTFLVTTFAQEIGIPLLPVLQAKLKRIAVNRRPKVKNDTAFDDKVEQCYYEAALSQYQSTYEDYLQLCIQFGYVVLFAVIDPFWVPLGALLNNAISLKSDLYKLTMIFKRPFARRTKNIGAWYNGFILLSILATISNCGLLYLQPDVMSYFAQLFPIKTDLAFVIFEHCLLGLQLLVYVLIHERPRSVRIALLKSEYESSQALKALKNRISTKLE